MGPSLLSYRLPDRCLPAGPPRSPGRQAWPEQHVGVACPGGGMRSLTRCNPVGLFKMRGQCELKGTKCETQRPPFPLMPGWQSESHSVTDTGGFLRKRQVITGWSPQPDRDAQRRGQLPQGEACVRDSTAHMAEVRHGCAHASPAPTWGVYGSFSGPVCHVCPVSHLSC